MVSNSRHFTTSQSFSYLICGTSITTLLFLSHNWNLLVEIMRPDDYSYGTPFYSVIFCALLLLNAVITPITQ